MRMTQRGSGIALVTAILILALVGSVAAIMLARTTSEIQNTGDDAGIVRTLMLARGTANLAGAVLQGPVRAALNAIVEESSSSVSRWSFGTGAANAQRPTDDSVAAALSGDAGSVANQLQAEIDDLLCDAPLPDVGEGNVISLRIHVTSEACGRALPSGLALADGRYVAGVARDGSGAAADQTYALPFIVVAEGRSGDYRRTIASIGELHVLVGRGSFARYALFTGQHTTTAGEDIWFTSDTLFDGPVHTNEHFRFYRSAWFGGEVTSAGCVSAGDEGCRSVRGTDQVAGAEFFGSGFLQASRMRPPSAPVVANRYGTHAPTFAAGVDWNASFVPLPDNAQDQEAVARASGIAVEGDVDRLTLVAGDANGDPVAGAAAEFQYVTVTLADEVPVCDPSGCVDAVGDVRYRVTPASRLEREACNEAECSWLDVGAWDGVIYVAGNVRRLTGPGRIPSASVDPDDAAPAIAAFTRMTLASEEDVRITGDLTYEDPPCSTEPERDGAGSVTPAVCENQDAVNLFGVYSAEGDVLIGNAHASSSMNAPRDVTIHGVLMSGQGQVAVENYNWGSPRGDVHLLGGIIGEYYGAFGTFYSATGAPSTGYGRSFTFDRRTLAGYAPPYFPTVGEDGVKSILVFTFGQREQLE